MSEYYGTSQSSEYLAHYGVKGMKWGVRRYLNSAGGLTKAGNARYGSSPTKHSSAMRIQRDFNQLDQSFANIHANAIDASARMNKYANKILRKGQKYISKGMTSKQAAMLVGKKYGKKLRKAAAELKATEAQKKGIENLQLRTLAQAKQNGYTVNSKPVKRLGMSNRDRMATWNPLGMGAIGGALTGALMAVDGQKNGKMIDGQQVRVRKNGDGSTRVVNYAHMNKKRGVTVSVGTPKYVAARRKQAQSGSFSKNVPGHGLTFVAGNQAYVDARKRQMKTRNQNGKKGR